ncbi:hypothetical protein EV05_0456 [Prochlorococcus sp. MIT 0601]|nr:hypothetical protein EV05_0456 [Prochlorococcus sp. MIT 0601]
MKLTISKIVINSLVSQNLILLSSYCFKKTSCILVLLLGLQK